MILTSIQNLPNDICVKINRAIIQQSIKYRFIYDYNSCEPGSYHVYSDDDVAFAIANHCRHNNKIITNILAMGFCDIYYQVVNFKKTVSLIKGEENHIKRDQLCDEILYKIVTYTRTTLRRKKDISYWITALQINSLLSTKVLNMFYKTHFPNI